MRYKILYWQHGGRCVEEFDNLERAVGLLRGGYDNGLLSPVGIYDNEENTVYGTDDRDIKELKEYFNVIDAEANIDKKMLD